MEKTGVRTSTVVQTKKLVTVAMFSTIAFILMALEFVIPIFPSFLKLDVSTLPGIIGGLMYGPIAGVTIEGIKNLLHLLLKNNDGLIVGEIANFLAGASFIFTAVVMHRLYKSAKGFVAGLALGTLLMTVIMAVANYYVLIPAYAVLYKVSVENLVQMFQMESLWSLILYGITPFNIVKGIIVSLIAYPIYLKILPRIQGR